MECNLKCPSNLKDQNKIDASRNFKFMDNHKDYLSKNNFSPESDLDSELEKCAKILDLESKVELDCLSNHKKMPGDKPENLDDFLLNDLLSPIMNSESLILELQNYETKPDFTDECFQEKKDRFNFVLNVSPTRNSTNLNSKCEFNQILDNKSSFLNVTRQLPNKDTDLIDEKSSNREYSTSENIDSLRNRSSVSWNNDEQVVMSANETKINVNGNSNEFQKKNNNILDSDKGKKLFTTCHNTAAKQIPNTEIQYLKSSNEKNKLPYLENSNQKEDLDIDFYKNSNLGNEIENTISIEHGDTMPISESLITNQHLNCQELSSDLEINDIIESTETRDITSSSDNVKYTSCEENLYLTKLETKQKNLSTNQHLNCQELSSDLEINDIIESTETRDITSSSDNVKYTSCEENLYLTKLETKQKNLLNLENIKSSVCSSASHIILDLNQESLLENDNNLNTLEIKNRPLINENFNLSNLMDLKKGKGDTSKEKDSIIANKQLFEIKNLIIENNRNPEKRNSREKLQSGNAIKNTDLNTIDKKDKFCCKEPSKGNASIQNTDQKECTHTKRFRTPEKHLSSRIFKLAVKSINNKNNSNSSSNKDMSIQYKNADNMESNKLKIVREEVSKKEEVNKEMECVKPLSNCEIKTNDEKKELKMNGNIKDYFENEKDDLVSSAWETVKNLTTNEERYQQVRKCWGSKKIPDPNKNLTYHSFKKRLIGSRHPEPRVITQHKRHASTNLNQKSAKRSCTFFLDKEINAIEKLKEKEKQEILNEMHHKISFIDNQCYQKEFELNKHGNDYFSYHNARLRQQFDSKVSVVADEYNEMVDASANGFRCKIRRLQERRNEILKFYGFYEGLNIINKDHPTELTETQFQELNEIDDVYNQFNHYYGVKDNNF